MIYRLTTVCLSIPPVPGNPTLSHRHTGRLNSNAHEIKRKKTLRKAMLSA